MITDLSAEQFVLCLRRFIALYGAPKKIHSDNATHFKLTEKSFDLIWNNVQGDEDVQSYVSEQGIQWHFITPHAPWKGGFYERLVALVKRSLKRTLGNSRLKYDEFITVVAEIAAMLNTRPLVYLTDDFNSETALTPQCFLKMSLNPKNGTPDAPQTLNRDDIDYVPNPTSEETLVEIWSQSQIYLHHFWKTWSDDYLLSLRERHRDPKLAIKPNKKVVQEPIKINDVVLIHDSQPRGTWKFGKVQELISSSDGQIRSAKVLLASKRILTRPINLLYPIETRAELHGEGSEAITPSTRERKPSEKALPQQPPQDTHTERPKRQSALKARQFLRDISNDL